MIGTYSLTETLEATKTWNLRSIYEETTTFIGTKKSRNRYLDYSFGNIGSFPILRCNGETTNEFCCEQQYFRCSKIIT